MDEVSVTRDIGRARDAWIAAINAGDPDGFAAALADDVVWIAAGSPAISTRAGVRDWLHAPFEQFDYEYSVTDVRLRPAGGWAAERARFETRANDRSGTKSPVHRGTYTILWRSTDGRWLIERYLDHTGWDPD